MPLILPCPTSRCIPNLEVHLRRRIEDCGRGASEVGYATLIRMFAVSLVARLHVDLQRVVSAACRIS
jgi:hypothetical protein